MAEATSTADPDPAAIAALKHVGLAGGLTETKVSCAALGDRLDASTQTASRRLQTLESVGYIERDVVGDGQWVRVTDAGEAALRAEYADYRRLFETDVELVLRGAVTGGEDRTYAARPHLRYGVTLVTGDERYEEVHAIVPDRTHHDDDQLELIAPERLRDALGLGDGDAVEVRVAATSRADTPKAMTWRRATTKTRPPADPVETEVA